MRTAEYSPKDVMPIDSSVGSFQGLLRRIDSNIGLLSSLVDGVERAADLVENRAVYVGEGRDGKDTPQPTLTLTRVAADLERQIDRLRELIPQIT